MACLERRADEIERLRELLGEEPRALAPEVAHDGERQEAEARPDRKRQRPGAPEDLDHEEPDAREQRDVEEDLAHALAEPRLADHADHGRDDGNAAEQGIQRRDA